MKVTRLVQINMILLLILLIRSLEAFLCFQKLIACWLLPVNVWLCRQIQTWRHRSVIHSVTGVNLRETGVRGTNRSHVGRGSPLMPRGLLCEKRQEGEEAGWILMMSASMCTDWNWKQQVVGEKRARMRYSVYFHITWRTGKPNLEILCTTCIILNKD